MTMLKDMVEPKALLGMQQAAGLVAWFVAEGVTKGHDKVVMLKPNPSTHDVISLGGTFYRVRSYAKHQEKAGLTVLCRDAGLRVIARLVLL